MASHASVYAMQGDQLADAARFIPRWQVWLARAYFGSFLAGTVRSDWYLEMASYFDKGDGMAEALATEWDHESDGGLRRIQLWTPITDPLMIAIPIWLHSIIYQSRHWTDVFAPWVGNAEAPLLLSASESGSLPASFRSLSESSARLTTAITEIVGKLTIVLGMLWGSIAGLYVLSVMFFPQYFASVRMRTLPPELAALKRMSDFAADWGIPVFILSAILPLVIVYSLPRLTGAPRRFLDHLFPYSIYRDWVVLSWLRGTGYLFAAGGGVHDVITLQIPYATPYLAERLRAILACDADRLGHALESSGMNWPRPRLIRKIKKHVTNDHPGAGLLHLAANEETRTIRAINRTAAVALQLSSLLMAVFMGWLLHAASQLQQFIK